MLRIINKTCRVSVLIFLAGWMVACSSAAPIQATISPTQAPAAETPMPPAEPTLPPTAEPAQPTETAVVEPTATTEPVQAEATATPAAPEALSADAIQGWCLPEDATMAMMTDPLNPPASARVGEQGVDALEIRNLPAFACVFSYKLNGPAPDSLQLQVFEARAAKPWLTEALAPVEGSPNTVSALLRHSYIIAPPMWDWSYTFALVDASTGTELRRDTVNMHRWEPALCWNQRKPNIRTGLCPLPQDQHPWDPWYGKPMPTAVHEEEN